MHKGVLSLCWVKFVNIPLTKASHMAKSSVRVGKDYEVIGQKHVYRDHGKKKKGEPLIEPVTLWVELKYWPEVSITEQLKVGCSSCRGGNPEVKAVSEQAPGSREWCPPFILQLGNWCSERGLVQVRNRDETRLPGSQPSSPSCSGPGCSLTLPPSCSFFSQSSQSCSSGRQNIRLHSDSSSSTQVTLWRPHPLPPTPLPSAWGHGGWVSVICRSLFALFVLAFYISIKHCFLFFFFSNARNIWIYHPCKKLKHCRESQSLLWSSLISACPPLK